MMSVGHYLFNRPDFNAIVPAIPFFMTYTLNLVVAGGFVPLPPYGQTWSLCIEEQFYILWPLVLRRLGLRGALRFAVSAIVGILVLRTSIYCWLNWGHLETPTLESVRLIYFCTVTRIDTILMGCALALSINIGFGDNLLKMLQKATWFPTVALCVAVLAIWWGTGAGANGGWRALTVGYTLMSATVAAVILALFIQPASWIARLLSMSALVFIGKISYGVYLFQPIVWNALSPFLGLRHQVVAPIGKEALALSLVWFGTIGVAWLHYRFIERCFLRPRERPVKLH
jgi:peptidoglycan/LPS O-acetylase OafA/YrhL